MILSRTLWALFSKKCALENVRRKTRQVRMTAWSGGRADDQRAKWIDHAGRDRVTGTK